jgi:hypothetical protein
MAAMSQMPPMPPPLPVRVESLAYELPSVGPRPGLVTAIGVMSIVVGGLGIVANGIGLIYGAIFWIAMATNGFAGIGMQNAAIPSVRSQFVVDANAAQPLTDVRKVNIDAMLTENGSAVMGTGSNFVPGVLSSGSLGTEGQYFVLPHGRLDVGDDFVVFMPKANKPAQSDDVEADPAAAAITPEQADGILQSVKQVAQTPLDATQEATFLRVVRANWQSFIDPKQDMLKQVAGAPRSTDGGLVIHATTGAVMYLPPPRPGPVVYAAPAPPQTGVVANGGGWFALATLESVLGLGLAVYLLVIGILVFRHSRGGKRQHWWYVWIKLPLVALGAVAWWKGMVALVIQTSRATTPQQAAQAVDGLAVMAIVVAVIVAAYPIGLLFALNARSVRDHYAGVRDPA